MTFAFFVDVLSQSTDHGGHLRGPGEDQLFPSDVPNGTNGSSRLRPWIEVQRNSASYGFSYNYILTIIAVF